MPRARRVCESVRACPHPRIVHRAVENWQLWQRQRLQRESAQSARRFRLVVRSVVHLSNTFTPHAAVASRAWCAPILWKPRANTQNMSRNGTQRARRAHAPRAATGTRPVHSRVVVTLSPRQHSSGNLHTKTILTRRLREMVSPLGPTQASRRLTTSSPRSPSAATALSSMTVSASVARMP
jgi:hypothetical protein